MQSRQALSGKTVVVTGARGGIGMAICRRFAREGATVIGADIGADDGMFGGGAGDGQDEVAQRCLPYDLDVTSEGAVARFGDHVKAIWGRLDILVNNAGAMVGKPLLETSLADLDRLMAVNVAGPFLLMRTLAPLMAESGAIINMSSGAATKPTANMSAYSASKAAVAMMSRVAAIELAPIRVNSILPGAIDTPMPRAFISNMSRPQQEKVMAGLSEGRLAKRLGRADEVAAMALYLASDEAAFVTGADFVIDGGRL
ncbi:MAG: SDR family oxidoreductase [Rhizobiales bacterium]|nr:SDR family oxidoreductase [Hyphomicrobiales bacterium]